MVKVRIEKIKSPPYPPCEECWKKAKFRIIVRYGQGNRHKETSELCKTHLKQSALLCKKFLKAFSGVIEDEKR